jgi:hypothetical protein
MMSKDRPVWNDGSGVEAETICHKKGGVLGSVPISGLKLTGAAEKTRVPWKWGERRRDLSLSGPIASAFSGCNRSPSFRTGRT